MPLDWNRDSQRDSTGLVKTIVKHPETREDVEIKDFKSKDGKDAYYIAHNGKDIYHYGKLDAGHSVITGQPRIDIYATEEEMLRNVPKEYLLEIV